MEERANTHDLLYSDKPLKDFLSIYLMKGLPDAFNTTDDAGTAVSLVLAGLAKHVGKSGSERIEGVGEFSSSEGGIIFKPDPGFRGLIE
ncbi:hypothetical protein [Desulfocurvibacter africanus]|uniref:hypothetical protein n=1 Tax=Desulfocurvibacter africanus TaxID=873 RepID=UPI0003FF4C96|nr:hypothetical protein [Desulfocurvibacter africanus]